jgi:hypothetical protein
MDESTLLEWFAEMLKMLPTDAGLRLSRTREGYVAKLGSHKSAPSPSATDALMALRTSIRGELTVGR